MTEKCFELDSKRAWSNLFYGWLLVGHELTYFCYQSWGSKEMECYWKLRTQDLFGVKLTRKDVPATSSLGLKLVLPTRMFKGNCKKLCTRKYTLTMVECFPGNFITIMVQLQCENTNLMRLKVNQVETDTPEVAKTPNPPSHFTLSLPRFHQRKVVTIIAHLKRLMQWNWEVYMGGGEKFVVRSFKCDLHVMTWENGRLKCRCSAGRASELCNATLLLR